MRSRPWSDRRRAGRVEIVVAFLQGGEQVGQMDDGRVRDRLEFLQPRVEQIRAVHQQRLVRAEGRHHQRVEVRGGDGGVVVQRIRRIIGGADHADVEFFQDPVDGEIRLGEFRIGPLPDLVGGVRG